MKKLSIMLFGLILLIPITTFADSKDVRLTIDGETNPNSTITVKLSYPYTDLGGTNIFWLENDKVVEEGINLLNHRVTLGSFGDQTKVTAIVGLPNSGGQVKNSIVISPATLDLIWEAQTAVPPFYKGKAVPTTDSPVRAMAIAYFGTTTPSTQVTYSWKKNQKTSLGEAINLVSAIFLAAWEGKSVNISATAKYGDITASRSMSVSSIRPSILFYEVSPTQGILTQESLNTNPIKNVVELAIKAIPFGFSNNEKDSNRIQYEWSLGDNKVKEGVGSDFENINISKASVTLKTGEIAVKLLAQNISNVMQYSETTFKWAFNQ